MKIINVNLGSEIDKIKLIALSDLHIGDKLCDYKSIKNVIDTIEKEKDTYVILNGDLMNCATKSSVSDVYAETISPKEQVQRLVEILTPIKDKILVIAGGNHEARIYKETGIDIVSLVAIQLGIEKRYAENWWYLYLRFGKDKNKKNTVYTITGIHGYGGGRKAGGKINNLIEMSDKVVADIYVMGHTHTPIITRNSVYIPDYQNKTLLKKDKYYLMTNSFLDYGGYGEKFGFTPSTTEHQEMELYGNKRKIRLIM